MERSIGELKAELETVKTDYDLLKETFRVETLNKQNEKIILEKLISSSEELIRFPYDTPDFAKISQIILDISGARYASFNLFDEKGLGFKTVAIAGVREDVVKAMSIIGFDVIGKEWQHDHFRSEITKSQSITKFKHLHELTRNLISKKAIDLLTSVFNIGETYIIKIAKEEMVLGDFTIFFKKGGTLLNSHLVELYAHQVGMFLDRIKITRELNHREALFRLLAENSTDMISRHDSNGIYLYASPSSKSLMGYEPEELIGHSALEFVHPDDVQIIIDVLKRLAEQLAVITIEFRVRRKNGQYIWFETIGRNFFVEGKNNAVEVHVSSRDVTKRKLAEEDLFKNRANLAAIIENTTASIWLVSRDYKLLYLNTVFAEAFKLSYGIELMPGMNIIDCIPQPIRLEWKAYYDRAFSNERFVFEQRFEYANQEFYYEISMNPIIVEGKVIGASVFSNDISDRKQVEKELIKAKEKAEESDRLKSAFLANMSHEIRTPMNGILGFADLLKTPDLSGEHQREYIGIIEKSGLRMLNTINDIIDISKIGSGQMKVLISDTNINDKIEYIYNFFKPEIEQKGIKISFRNSLTSEESIIKTDPEKIYAILTNLVKNSIKFSDTGTIELGYDLKGAGTSAELLFYVKDNGIGISKEKQDSIFERFVQGDLTSHRAHQGAGLGLSITKAYVNMLGGNIWVESDPGIGSVFYFTIPYTHIDESKEHSQKTFINEAEHKEIRKLNILIAEDDVSSELFLRNIIKPFSGNVICAKNGIEAVEICKEKNDLDLILMDIQMPGITGYEAIRQIRNFNKNVIIISQTAYALSGDIEKSLEAGANDYISKPVKTADMHILIQKYFTV
jgi:hypothetical protein